MFNLRILQMYAIFLSNYHLQSFLDKLLVLISLLSIPEMDCVKSYI